MKSAYPTNPYVEAVRRKVHEERRQALNPVGRYLDGVVSLPPPPMVMTQLLALFRDPDRDIDQVVQVIRYEPSLTAQILRTCNSACFAGEQPIGDIFDAVTRMGFYQVYCLVVSLFGASTRSIPGADKGVNVEELWRHSVAAAVSASVVEQEQDGEAKAAAFTAGLLRDIGRLVFASTEQESYAKLIQRARDQGVPLFSMERSVLGIDHAELGGELLRRWELPPDIVAAVAHHHNFEAGPRYEHLTAIVQVGEMIGDRLLDRDLADTGLLTGSSATLETLQLTPDDFPHLVAKAQAEMDKVQGMLGI